METSCAVVVIDSTGSLVTSLCLDTIRTYGAGGTAFNFGPNRARLAMYQKSAERFRDIVTRANADVIISNHTNYDGSKPKFVALQARKPGEKHPYVVGNDVVRRYLDVADHCAQAALAGVK